MQKEHKEHIAIYLMTPEKPDRKWQKWMGLYGIGTETRRVFFSPLAVGYSDRFALICSNCTSTDMFLAKCGDDDKDHLLIDIEWLITEARKLPDAGEPLAQQIMSIRDRIIKRHEHDNFDDEVKNVQRHDVV